jgi:AcrR family transcriptional regulator
MNTRFTRGAATRARIIRVAADLFHKQGVGATSPDQVIEASETGKGQFYHYFKSKEGLVHEVLQTYLDDIAKGIAPLSYEIDSWEDLERWFFSNIDTKVRYLFFVGITRESALGFLFDEECRQLVLYDLEDKAEILAD